MLTFGEPGGPVLVVDEDASQRALLRVLLQRIGLDIVEAEDGETALRSAELPGGAVCIVKKSDKFGATRLTWSSGWLRTDPGRAGRKARKFGVSAG